MNQQFFVDIKYPIKNRNRSKHQKEEGQKLANEITIVIQTHYPVKTSEFTRSIIYHTMSN